MALLIYPKRALSTARDFNGTSDEIVASSLTLPGGPVSVSFWLNNDVTKNSSAVRMTDGGDNLNLHCPWGDGTVYWDYPGTANGRVTAAWGNRNGRYIHVGLTSSGNNSRAIYFDGVLQNSETATDVAPDLTSALYVGSLAGSNFQNGKISEFAIHLAEFSPAEVRKLAARRVSPLEVRRRKLFVYYSLDGTTNPERDLSGNGRHGVVTGTKLAQGPPQVLREIAPRRRWVAAPAAIEGPEILAARSRLAFTQP